MGDYTLKYAAIGVIGSKDYFKAAGYVKRISTVLVADEHYFYIVNLFSTETHFHIYPTYYASILYRFKNSCRGLK